MTLLPLINYRASHQSADYGAKYNLTYQSGYYAKLWRRIERPLLESILRRVARPEQICLDFACGTGRIADAASPFFQQVIGVDISETMLASASVPDNVRLCRADITKTTLDETFDVATAFRFFLRAEDSLKRDALAAIHRHLRERGWLICDVHVNASSPLGVAARILNPIRSEKQEVLSQENFFQFLNEAGFEIVDAKPYGYLPRPGRLLPRLCESLIEPVETICRKLRVPGRFAQAFIVVARKSQRVV